MQVIETLQRLPLPTGIHFACAIRVVGAALRLPEDVTHGAFSYASLRALGGS
jgi:hypothetical protein